MGRLNIVRELIGAEDLDVGSGDMTRTSSDGGDQTLKKLNLATFAAALTTFSVNNTTPSVLDNHTFLTANTAATTITDFDDGVAGQVIFVLFNDAFTKIDFTSTILYGNGGADWTPVQYDHMTCVSDGTRWFCTISDNTTYNQLLDED